MKKNFQFSIFNFPRGFGIVEIVVAVAIISAVVFGLLVVSRNFLLLSRITSNQVKASYLLEEGLEAVRSIRDRSWAGEIAPLVSGTNYYFYFGAGTWQTTTTAQVIDGFTRSFQVSDVYRDANDDIAESGTLDPNTKKFKVQVSWQDRATTSRQRLETYLTNFFDN